MLRELGVSDFGLYAVVGGIVTIMGFMSTAMLATSYRYIAVELGKGSDGDLNKVFNTSLVIHLILAFLLVMIGETIGTWYINNYLNVANNKITDALFVLHFSVLAAAFSVLSVPYNGLISAKENFIVRSSIDIIRVLFNLGFVLLLVLYIGNKLRAYAIIMAVVMIIPLVLLFAYCYSKDRDVVKWRFNKRVSDYLDMFSFAGWILVGTIAYIGVRQGAAIIINLFFGTLLNAAFGIATQINNHIIIFVKNLNQAAVPQIMKTQSGGDSGRSLNLVYYISKYAFFIMFIPAVPMILSIDYILILWLKEVPEYTVEFTILMIVNGLIGVTASGFDAAIQATGNIRIAQIWYSTIMLLTLPIAYLMFKLNYPPYIITIITILATLTNRFVQIKILTKITEFKIFHYRKRTVFPVILVSLVTIPQIWLRKLFGQDIIGVLFFSIISVCLISLSVYFIGLTRSERLTINHKFSKKKITKT